MSFDPPVRPFSGNTYSPPRPCEKEVPGPYGIGFDGFLVLIPIREHGSEVQTRVRTLCGSMDVRLDLDESIGLPLSPFKTL